MAEVIALVVLFLLVPVAFLILATIGFTAGSAGIAVALAIVVAIAALVTASWLAARRRVAGTAVAQGRAREQWLAEFPASVRHVAEIVTDDWKAAMVWAKLGLGKEPDYAKGEPGEWPRPEPSQNSVPADLGIWATKTGAMGRFAMVTGQKPKHFIDRLDEFAVAFDIMRARVVDTRGRLICVEFTTVDTLAKPQPVPRPPEQVDLTAVPVGGREDGEHWVVPLLYRNLLVVGVPGAGKSGFLRSILVATAPAARDGILRNLMIDCKFGIEAASARGLLHEVAGTQAKALKMLRWLREDIVEPRGRYMEANGIDKHVPTVDEPMYHLSIDEIAELLDDPDTRKELLKLLVSLGRLGRALGVSISGFTQIPNKRVLDVLRDLFQIRIGLRLVGSEQIAMVYGDHSAAERGAANTTIPDVGSEGVAYVVEDGTSQIIRVRAFQVTREDLAWAAATFPIYRDPVQDKAAHDRAAESGAQIVMMPRREERPPASLVPPALPGMGSVVDLRKNDTSDPDEPDDGAADEDDMDTDLDAFVDLDEPDEGQGSEDDDEDTA